MRKKYKKIFLIIFNTQTHTHTHRLMSKLIFMRKTFYPQHQQPCARHLEFFKIENLTIFDCEN